MNNRIVLSSLSIFASVALVAGATFAFFTDEETSTGNTFTAGEIDLQIDNTSYLNGEFNQGTSWTLTDLTTELFFNFGDVKPGDWGEDTISLHVDSNESWVCADVTLTSDNDNGLTEPESEAGDTTGGVGEGELADDITFVWWADDGDNVLEDGENVLPGGPLGTLAVNETSTVTLADSTNNIWTQQPNDPLDGATTVYVGKAWCFGDFTLSPVAQDGFGFVGNTGENGPDVRSTGVDCNGDVIDNTTQSDSLTADIAFTAIQSRSNDSFVCGAQATAIPSPSVSPSASPSPSPSPI